MESIPTFRAAHLFPYLELLRKVGVPVERGLRQANLPTSLSQQNALQLPLLQTLDFLTAMAQNEGIDDLALRAKEHSNIKDLSPVFLNSVFSAPTLKTALEAFFSCAIMENTTLDVWMVCGKTQVNIYYRHRIPFDAQRSRHLELNTCMMLVAITRAFTDAKWYPEKIALRSNLPLGQYAKEQFPHTRFLLGEKVNCLTLPRSMLSRAPQMKHFAGDSPSPIQQDLKMEKNFPATLKLVLGSYLGDGHPGIELAAEIAGTSVRTLQRRLEQHQLSYSDLLQQTLFESSIELLKNQDIRTLDVAYAVGYKDPSNFSRAFRRIAGVSPKEYREQLYD